MAERNFFGRLRDSAANRIAPGNVYDERGNYLNNGARAGLATAIKIGANMFFPGTGMIVDKVMAPWVNRGANYGIGEVQREGVPIYGAPSSAQQATYSPTQNLGLGAQSPGNTWAGYLQSQGSANNFGNTQFGTGMASMPGSWSPSSQWGQQITAQPAAPGSNLGFGNNAQQFAGGGGGGGGGGSSMGGSRMGGIVGGRLANDSMLDVQRRWASK